MESYDFMEGFFKIINILENENVAIMCMERFSKNCHRQLIGDFLNDINIQVIHL